jgi:hypothetical protein
MTDEQRDLYELRDEVCDEATFLEFVTALCADWSDERAKAEVTPIPPGGAGANGWENGTIGDFLGAAAAWGEATRDGTPFYTPSTNVWRRCADILHAGKFYE